MVELLDEELEGLDELEEPESDDDEEEDDELVLLDEPDELEAVSVLEELLRLSLR